MYMKLTWGAHVIIPHHAVHPVAVCASHEVADDPPDSDACGTTLLVEIMPYTV
jgi:hypothetical protein